MTPSSRHHQAQENHHGVLLNIAGNGVFIIGEAGIGKSSLALDLIHGGHTLIADDCIDFKIDSKQLVTGHCPSMLAGLLHTRELGLLSLSDVFGPSSSQAKIQLDYVIHLKKNLTSPSTLSAEPASYRVCEQSFPMLMLDINTPATLINRINTWLHMQAKTSTTSTAAITLIQRQQIQMETLQ